MRKHGYIIDPRDPRAPSQADWDAMDEEERARIVEALPSEDVFDVLPPEGDPHRKAKESALDALSRYYARVGRRVYLSAELNVYYPDQPRVSPDIMAVLDVELHDRMSWVVSSEKKGLDFALEVHVSGEWARDSKRKVVQYAKLGIPEYFIFDRGRSRLMGYRLPSPDAREYAPIVPDQGRFASRVLGLELALEGEQLRFFHGTAALAGADDLIAKAGSMVDELIAKRERLEGALEEERRRAAASKSALEDERRRSATDALAAEARIAAAEARADAAEARLRELDGSARGTA